jgi:hypothetical protein
MNSGKKGQKKLTMEMQYYLFVIGVGNRIVQKQVELCTLDEIGLQKFDNPANFVYAEIDGKMCNWGDVAKNDGLSFDDFCEWFKSRQKEPMAVIHFTDFRYCG